MNKNKIFLGLVMAAALLFAIVVGRNVAENNFSRLGMYVGIAALAIGALGLKQNAWLLIPICSGLGGTIGGGRLPASIAEMSVAFCFGLFVLFKALKVIPKFPRGFYQIQPDRREALFCHSASVLRILGASACDDQA
jgi:hypothetical protein